MDTIQVNGQPYTVTRLLGKGKGGYSYLAQGSEGPVVVKQIHHEPCSYYQFGDKLQSELRDYRTLSALGIPMPRLLAVDEAQERLVKQYIPGPTVLEQLQTGTLPPQAEEQMRALCRLLYPCRAEYRLLPHQFYPVGRRALLCGLRVQSLRCTVGFFPLGQPLLGRYP